jgi:hypothetical protein
MTTEPMTNGEKRAELQQKVADAKQVIATSEWWMSVHSPKFDKPQVGGRDSNRAARQFHTRRRDEWQVELARLEGELAQLLEEGCEPPAPPVSETCVIRQT